MKSSLLAALLSAASAAALAAQAPHATAGGDPRTLPEERWALADTSESGALRHITPDDYVDVRGYRFLWMRVSRPDEPTKLFFARMVFNCARKMEGTVRFMTVRNGAITGEMGQLSPLWMPGRREPQQARLIQRVCALPSREQSSGPPAPDRLYEFFEVDQEAAIADRGRSTRIIAAEYTAEMRQRGDTGTVVVSAVIRATGAVDSASVAVAQSSNPVLNEAAMRAVRRLHFSPARSGRLPVPVRVFFPIRFSPAIPIFPAGESP
jgi:TonB family protein